MAFTLKLTNLLSEASEVAHADGASMFAFILKNQGHDAQSYGANQTAETAFCAMAALVTEIEEQTGLSRKEIFGILDKTMKETGPLKHEPVDDEDE